MEETKWLLSLAERHDFIKGVVGWVPLSSSEREAVMGGNAEEFYLRPWRL